MMLSIVNTEYAIRKVVLGLLYVFGILGVSLGMWGCASETVYSTNNITESQVVQITQGKRVELHSDYIRMHEEGGRNEVLNRMEIGLSEMDLGDFVSAENSFDFALSGIELIYADNDVARKAREGWYETASVDFKGHPYERAMAYYYRGLLYLVKNDYENARACFKNGVLQDVFVEEEQNQCDFGLLIFLSGWASQCNGEMDLANEYYLEVEQLRTGFVRPDENANTLLIAETGRSPRKVPDGVGHSQLKFFRGRSFTENSASFVINGNTFRGYPVEDLYFQASTRGGRAIESILEGRIAFKQEWESKGTAMLDISTNLMIAAPAFGESSGVAAGIAGGIGLVGALSVASAQNAKVRADFRYWTNLPDAVHIATSRTESNAEVSAGVEFFTADDLSNGDVESIQLHGDFGSYKVGWARSRSAIVELHESLNKFMVMKGRK